MVVCSQGGGANEMRDGSTDFGHVPTMREPYGREGEGVYLEGKKRKERERR